MNLIKSFGDFAVSFNDCGYLNATQIAKQFDKRINNYLRSEQTQQYIAALLEVFKARNSAMTKNQLVIVQKGGNVHFSGTWLHPKLAVDFARWLDPKFAVWCDEQIEQILSGSLKLEPPRPALPALPKGSVVLSADEVGYFREVLKHLPYCFAYYYATAPAVSRLNQSLTYRTHDRFQQVQIFASKLAKSLNLPLKSHHDVAYEIY